MMKGKQSFYGWIAANEGTISGKAVEIQGFEQGEVKISWYDPWTGDLLGEETTE